MLASAIIGLTIGASTFASASPAAGLLNPGTDTRAGGLERIDFTWTHHNNHHHRSWDRAHHRWFYYG
jgi:hypothetical protein